MVKRVHEPERVCSTPQPLLPAAGGKGALFSCPGHGGLKTASLTARYVTALFLVALLVTLTHLLTRNALRRQDSDAPLINFSGRQRMLSQRLTKEALLLVRASSAGEREHYREALRATVTTWARVHTGLQQGDRKLGLPGDNSTHIRQLFAASEPHFCTIVGAVTNLVSATADDVDGGAVEVESIVAASTPYLECMDRVVFRYHAEAQARVRVLGTRQIHIIGCVFVLLFIEVVFIFRPMVKHVRDANGSLARANDRMEEELGRRRQAEAANDRLSKTKDEFISIASHSLKNSLAVVQFASGFVRKAVRPGSAMTVKAHEAVCRTRDQADEMLRTIEDFLDFHALQDGRMALLPSTVNVNTIAQHVVDDHSECAAAKQICLATDLVPTVAEVYADDAKIGQVMANYVSNAIKFSPSQSEVTVRTEATDGQVRVEVTDTGPGLTDEDLLKVFGKYERLSAKPTGGEKSSGLGLAICKGIVELHGGSVGVRRNPEQGVTFWLRLPRRASLESGAQQLRAPTVSSG
jgi:signal transduction histidine kinase